jgi:hypothetical protein
MARRIDACCGKQNTAMAGGRGEAMSDPGDAMRVSDAERDAVVRVLGEHASVGRLTLDELEERSAKALEAKTRGDLAALTADLPAESAAAGSAADITTGAPSAVLPAKPRRPVRWLVSVIGGGHHSGRFRAVGSVNAIAILGGAEVDLRNAEIEGGELTVNAFAILGGPTIYVPDTVEVETGGIAILGGVQQEGSRRTPRPGAPLIRIRGFAVIGGARVVRLPPEARGMSARDIRLAVFHGRFRGEDWGGGPGGSGDGQGGFGSGPGGFGAGRRGRGGFGPGGSSAQ